MKPIINPAEVRTLFRYDAVTGALHWLRQTPHKPAGAKSTFYWVINIRRRRYFAHRLVWAFHHGRWPAHEIDHINGDKFDNRIENLRDVPRRVNKQNIRKANAGNPGLLGTHLFRNGRWKASINIDGHNRHLGYFDTTEEAHAAYLAAKRAHHVGSTL